VVPILVPLDLRQQPQTRELEVHHLQELQVGADGVLDALAVQALRAPQIQRLQRLARAVVLLVLAPRDGDRAGALQHLRAEQLLHGQRAVVLRPVAPSLALPELDHRNAHDDLDELGAREGVVLVHLQARRGGVGATAKALHSARQRRAVASTMPLGWAGWAAALWA
jgi:hypothetical protein